MWKTIFGLQAENITGKGKAGRLGKKAEKANRNNKSGLYHESNEEEMVHILYFVTVVFGI